MPPPPLLRQRLAELEGRISQHKSALRDLKEQRSAILVELAGVTYPVLTLPPEITAEIFRWCVDLGKEVLPSVAPLLLTQICRDWRVLAISTPNLWDTITEMDFSTVTHPEAEAVTDTWMSRAGPRPLNVRFDSPRSAWFGPALLRHASQLESLHVIADSDVLHDLAAVPSFPILRELALCCLSEHMQPLSIQAAPALRNLSLDRVLPSVVTVPWAQLTKISLSSAPLSECVNALRWATSLEEFSREEAGTTSDELSTVDHSSLVSLVISSRDDEDILPLLTLPRLQRFRLGGHYAIHEPGMDNDVVLFLSRVSGTLRAFTVGMSPTVPVQWLHPLTQLTTLELVRSVHRPFKTDVIRALDRRTSPDLLPKLQSFVFSTCRSDQVHDDLLDALDSRCDASDATHCKLESFSLIWPRVDPNPAAPLPVVKIIRLRALVGRGMRIHVGTRDQNSFY